MSPRTLPVSVLLPVFNGGPWIAGAIESIIEQTYRDWELVVVDDGSTDETGDILRRYADSRVRVIRHPGNRGLVAALNSGIAECRGEWIARMDADDTSLPERLERQLHFLAVNPTIDILGSWWRLEDESGRNWVHQLPETSEAIEWQMLFTYSMAHPTTIARKALLEASGGYDAAFAHVEDIDLWTRLLAKGARAANLQEVLYQRRLHRGSVCARYSGVQCEHYRDLRERMLRRWFGEPARDRDLCLLAKVLSESGTLSGAEIDLCVDLLLETMERFVRTRTMSAQSLGEIRRTLTLQIVGIAQRNGYVHPAVVRQWWRWLLPDTVKRMLRWCRP